MISQELVETGRVFRIASKVFMLGNEVLHFDVC